MTGIDFKKPYTSWKYLLIENQSSSFIVNSIGFFTFYVPMVFLIYLIFNLLSRLIKKCFRFVFFQQFRLFWFFVFLIMNGTIELFAYWFISDCNKLFQLKTNQKFINTFTVTLFFVFVFYVFAFILLAKAFYKKYSKYFLSNNRTNINGICNEIFEINFINFLLGMVHFIFENFYLTQLFVLFFIEILYLTQKLAMLKSKKIFRYKYC